MRIDVVDGLRGPAVLCIPRGTKLRAEVQPEVAARVDAIIETLTAFPGEDVC